MTYQSPPKPGNRYIYISIYNTEINHFVIIPAALPRARLESESPRPENRYIYVCMYTAEMNNSVILPGASPCARLESEEELSDSSEDEEERAAIAARTAKTSHQVFRALCAVNTSI